MMEVIIDYTNWRGERRERRIRPLEVLFSNTDHHPEKQWLLRAMDLEKMDFRMFALKDIHAWRAAM